MRRIWIAAAVSVAIGAAVVIFTVGSRFPASPRDDVDSAAGHGALGADTPPSLPRFRRYASVGLDQALPESPGFRGVIAKLAEAGDLDDAETLAVVRALKDAQHAVPYIGDCIDMRLEAGLDADACIEETWAHVHDAAVAARATLGEQLRPQQFAFVSEMLRTLIAATATTRPFPEQT